MVSYSDFEALVIIFICGVVGIVFAMIFTTIYDQGYFVDALSNMNITIEEVRIIVIVVWLIVGIIIAAVKK